MHRNDDSKFLLYIEPPAIVKLKEAVLDDLTRLLEKAMAKAEKGSANYSDLNGEPKFHGGGWRGTHETECGTSSDNHDYLLENGLITNSLCMFYVKWYRNFIKYHDWKKLEDLAKFYKVKWNDEWSAKVRQHEVDHWLYGKNINFAVKVQEETSCGKCAHREVCSMDMDKRCMNFNWGRSGEVGCQSCMHKYTRFDKDDTKLPCFYCPDFLAMEAVNKAKEMLEIRKNLRAQLKLKP